MARELLRIAANVPASMGRVFVTYTGLLGHVLSLSKRNDNGMDKH